MTTSRAADAHHMLGALALARRGLGNVWPNPAVGCVIVAGGDVPRLIGRGWTQPGGRPHAEMEALERARALGGDAGLTGATAYVTLEPCDHHGKTPPCSVALKDAGIATVVVACEDPNPRVSGAGLARLKAAGIAVRTGVAETAARELNAGFFLAKQEQRPLVTLKTATTLDGRIATANGTSQWITGAAARRRAHLLRAQHDAVMVGSETALHDNPRLDCRLDGLAARSPVRIVADSRLRLTTRQELGAPRTDTPTWLLTREPVDVARADPLRRAGVEVLPVSPGDDGRLEMGAALMLLAGRGITRLLVEGGGALAATLLQRDLVDRIAWFRAPILIGGDGVPAAGVLGVSDPGMAQRFARRGVLMLNDDVLETYART